MNNEDIEKLDEFLTIKETADLFKVNQITVRRMVQKEEIPAFRFGRAWRINKKELIEKLKDN